jgi:spore germination protein GerM
MEEHKSISKNVVASVSALAAAAVLAGGGIAWLSMQNRTPVATNTPSAVNSPAPTTVDPARVGTPVVTPMPAATTPISGMPSTTVPATPTTGTQTTPNPTVAQNQETTIKIWRLDDNGTKTFLVPQTRKIASAATTPNADSQLTSSLTTLLAGKPDGKLTSTIPSGTKLLSASVKGDGIHVDLSKEFMQGSAGATSTIGRLGQVIYTATEQNPDAAVWITVEGKKVEVLGDAGIEVRQPMTRQTYSQDFPIDPAANGNN